MEVHNHGTEEGAGLTCSESRLPDGSLIGACLLDQDVLEGKRSVNDVRRIMGMAFTGHGHHIPGTIQGDTRPTNVARCGGVNVCPRCKDDVQALMGNASPGAKPQKIEHVDYVALAKKALVRYIDGTSISLEEKYAYEVYTVMFSKTLNTWRALMITDMPDNIMYELVGDGNTIHVNEYMKVRSKIFED